MALPKDTIEALGMTGPPHLYFRRDGVYALPGHALADIEAVMRRLYTDKRIHADEMRDLANMLRAHLEQSEDVDSWTEYKEQ